MYYVYNSCEFVTVKLLRAIDRLPSGDIAIVIPDDNMFVAEHGREPLKTSIDRLLLAASLKKVGYVCEVTSDDDYVEPIKIEDAPREKCFKVGYVPGTFDLVHPGHIELIEIAKSQCEIVVVGVNSDMQVWANKHKQPRHNQSTRMFIMEHIKGVDGVILVETNDKNVANQQIIDLVGYPINAIFYGQDLRGKSINDEGGLEVESVYTPRSPEKMQKVSSTAAAHDLDELLKRNTTLETENNYLKSILQQV